MTQLVKLYGGPADGLILEVADEIANFRAIWLPLPGRHGNLFDFAFNEEIMTCKYTCEDDELDSEGARILFYEKDELRPHVGPVEDN